MKPTPRPAERGLVLILALIVLAAMSLAAVGLMRGVFSSNRVAGNLASQQAAVQAADVGIERAVAWLEQQARATTKPPPPADSTAPAIPSTALHRAMSADMKYSAVSATPGEKQTWEDFWTKQAAAGRVNSLPTDANGNQVSFMIHRLCRAEGAPEGANCDTSPDVRAGEGSSKGNAPQVQAPSIVYYRITVRVQGPRNANSFIQAVVSI